MPEPPDFSELTHVDILLPAEGGERADSDFAASFDLSRVPTSAGCYLMHDEARKIIYVGKAKNLRARIRSYINETDSRYTVKFLMNRVAGIDFLVTANEKEALLLENHLIKQHRPRYNVHLKDDKTHVMLRVNIAHDFPRVTVTRKFRKDGSKYFGPYSSAGSVRETLKAIQRVFPLRTCSDAVLNNRSRPCLYYQMKQCTAPCVRYIDRERYRALVDQVLLFLDGRSADLEKDLVRQIQALADELEFEKAAELRDRLYALRRTLERQRTVTLSGEDERDVVGVYTHGRFSEIQVLFYRHGVLSGGRSFSFNRREMPLEETLGSFLLQYYSELSMVPAEILIPAALEEAETMSDLLSDLKGGRVHVHFPQRGEKRALIELANKNAQTNFEEKRMMEKANTDLIDVIKEALQLPKLPNRIECFDISTHQGDKPVGSMVTFTGAQPDKKRYRRYSIKTVEGQDDFAMMREMLLRRFQRAVQEDDLPDLALIDGGKGQLNVAVTVLKDLGIEDVPAVGIAKSRALDSGSRSPERFFVPGRANPIVLPQHSPVVLLLARIRDEAHRFAITYNRKRRSKSTLQTSLTGIPGVGLKRARLLLNRMGSLSKVRDASIEEIESIPGFSRALAESVKLHLARANESVTRKEP
ncbi:MAG: UvrABC system protein C [Candidatus Hydrogenedentota bacterium]